MKKLGDFAIFLLLIVITSCSSDSEDPSNSQQEYSPPTFTQNTEITATGPQDNAYLYVSMDVNIDGLIALAWQGYDYIYFSTSNDGGETFTNYEYVDPSYPPSQGNPEIAFDPSGVLYILWSDIRHQTSIYFTKSYDDGATFSMSKPIFISESPQSKPSIVTAEGGQLYVVWDQIRADQSTNNTDVYFSKSLDYGETFCPPMRINQYGDWASGNSKIAVSNIGEEVFVVWDRGNGQVGIYFAKSFDSGDTFPVIKRIDTQFSNGGYAPSIVLDKNEDIYIVWCGVLTFNRSILFCKSTDRGETFTPPIVVNESAAWAIEPSINVDSDGRINIVWADRRDDEHFDIYFSQSTDGGESFHPNIRVDDSTSSSYQKFPRISSGEQDQIYVAWSDGRNCPEALYCDIYFSRGEYP